MVSHDKILQAVAFVDDAKLNHLEDSLRSIRFDLVTEGIAFC